MRFLYLVLLVFSVFILQSTLIYAQAGNQYGDFRALMREADLVLVTERGGNNSATLLTDADEPYYLYPVKVLDIIKDHEEFDKDSVDAAIFYRAASTESQILVSFYQYDTVSKIFDPIYTKKPHPHGKKASGFLTHPESKFLKRIKKLALLDATLTDNAYRNMALQWELENLMMVDEPRLRNNLIHLRVGSYMDSLLIADKWQHLQKKHLTLMAEVFKRRSWKIDEYPFLAWPLLNYDSKNQEVIDKLIDLYADYLSQSEKILSADDFKNKDLSNIIENQVHLYYLSEYLVRLEYKSQLLNSLVLFHLFHINRLNQIIRNEKSIDIEVKMIKLFTSLNRDSGLNDLCDQVILENFREVDDVFSADEGELGDSTAIFPDASAQAEASAYLLFWQEAQRYVDMCADERIRALTAGKVRWLCEGDLGLAIFDSTAVHFQVYPRKSQGKFVVKASGESLPPLRVAVYNPFGVRVFENSLLVSEYGGQQIHRAVINLGLEQPNGSYWLVLTDGQHVHQQQVWVNR